MKKSERIKMVKAMEFICRQINDEDILYKWLMFGVADGDIKYGDLTTPLPGNHNLVNEAAWSYCEDSDSFAELMHCFLRRMAEALEDGGLYCDDVVSGPRPKKFKYWNTLRRSEQ